MKRAKKFYEKSIELTSRVSALYNLSQVSRKTRDFTKGEEYFLSAQKRDREAVSRFQEVWSRNPNRFVIDEVLPLSVLLKYAYDITASVSTMGLSALPPSMMPVIALFFGVIFYILEARIKSRAFRCKKCGTILCNRCEKHLLWGQMCPKCFSSLVKLSELDAKERIARLQTVYDYQIQGRRVLTILFFILPGAAHIYGGNVLKGLFFLWPFLFLLSIIIISPLFVVGMSYFSHFWLRWIALLLLIIVYVTSIIVVRRRLARGWL